MIKNIRGRKYNTAKTEVVKIWKNDTGAQILHVKRSGEFFLYIYINGGEREIKPLTYKEAVQWSEEHMSTEEMEAVFGNNIDDDTKKTVAYSLPVSLIRKVKMKAREQQTTQSKVIAALIENMK